MEEKIMEVVKVLLGINCPVGMYEQIGQRIRLCADRLVDIVQMEKEQTEAQEEPEAEDQNEPEGRGGTGGAVSRKQG